MINKIYQGKTAVFATKHAKEKATKWPFLSCLGLNIVAPENLDTDLLGTFTGEIPRLGSMEETVLKKARMGLEQTGLTLAIANEGSFGPHPANPFVANDYELMVFIDTELDFHVIESFSSSRTNYARFDVQSFEELQPHLIKIGFPKHALIVKPKEGRNISPIYKGLTNLKQLKKAIKECVQLSPEKIAHVETDMRANFNPTRRQIIRSLSFKLIRRLNTFCKACHLPGWGLVDVEKGLPCETCGMPTELIRAEIFGCIKCDYQVFNSRSDGKKYAETTYCSYCNP